MINIVFYKQLRVYDEEAVVCLETQLPAVPRQGDMLYLNGEEDEVTDCHAYCVGDDRVFIRMESFTWSEKEDADDNSPPSRLDYWLNHFTTIGYRHVARVTPGGNPPIRELEASAPPIH